MKIFFIIHRPSSLNHVKFSLSWNWGTHGWPMASPWRRVRWLIRPGAVAMAARRIVAATEVGGRPFYHPFRPLP
jgi:hypothetical protein